MGVVQRKLTNTFNKFFESEKSSGILIIACTAVSLLFTNSILGNNYLSIWQGYIGGMSVEHWINDGLMAVFFFLIGLELKRELLVGELSELRNALLPIFAAIGGVVLPAAVHFGLNFGTPTQAGIGIPMATDIAFALGALALLGSRVPASLKVFLTALAVIDDLVAIIVIAVFYTAELSIIYLSGASAIFVLLLGLNHLGGVKRMTPYLIGGFLLWYLMLQSGVHATIAGVLAAFTIPFSPDGDEENSPSHRLEHLMHKPSAFIILPIFALANTGIIIGGDWFQGLSESNSLGIIIGLVAGKPIGITLACFIVVTFGICRLPLDLNWKHVFGAGLLGGIGFTMSIFITNLAFTGNTEVINASKMAILLASLTAGTIGFIWLKLLGKPEASDEDMNTMDFGEVNN
ncbi:MAG: Na+/H+ antiporter NhaA [Pyrinomonadaceae bacterium]